MIDPAVAHLGFEDYLARIRTFTDGELIPRENDMVRQGEVPVDLVARMAQEGLFAMTLPREWDGLGWTLEEQVLLTMEFTRASCVYRSRFSTTIGLASQILLDFGTADQQARYLCRMAAGETVAAFALTEREAGSDATNVQSTARRVDDGYVLDGAKRYITNGAWADLLLVFARVVDDTGPHAALSGFLVPRQTPGVTAAPAVTMNGHQEAPVAEVWLENVRVGPDALIGGTEGNGLQQAFRGLNHARLHVAATAVGQATRILDEATAYALEREQFGQPLADLGSVESKLGRSYAELEAGRALVLSCAREFDASGAPPRARIAAAKLYCTEMVGEVADRAVQILGGAGIVGDHPVPRMWRDVRALRIYEGASEVHERNLARHCKRRVGASFGVGQG